MMGDNETLQEILAGMVALKKEIIGLRHQMQDGFQVVKEDLQVVKEDLHEVRAIQDAHGKELSQLQERVESINRKLSRLGEVLR